MGEPISDIDVATDATPDQTMSICTHAGFRCIPTGIDHGTITVVVEDQTFEVTTFRKDVATDGRRAVVAFSTDVADDARRRDFTMNALYADPQGYITDPVHGYEDAKARRVRFIDDAGQRIREDYLRTLRYFRFCAQYAPEDAGWDAEALAGISGNLDGLDTLSAERVGAEMVKLLTAPNPFPALCVMHQAGVLAQVLPGADPTLVGPYVHVEMASQAPIDPMGRFAALGGEDVVARLRLSRRDQRHLDSIRTCSASSDTPKVIGQLAGFDAGCAAILLRSAYANSLVGGTALQEVRVGAEAIFPISASDLPQHSGPELGAELKRLRQIWLASDLEMTKQQLLAS